MWRSSRCRNGRSDAPLHAGYRYSPYAMKGNASVLKRLQKVPIGDVCISAISHSELAFGTEVSPAPAQERSMNGPDLFLRTRLFTGLPGQRRCALRGDAGVSEEARHDHRRERLVDCRACAMRGVGASHEQYAGVWARARVASRKLVLIVMVVWGSGSAALALRNLSQSYT